ncbi:MAG TPA: MarR family transcriptional regulator [Miltoncostaeaceae bacterium]|nr:MarR family transcriptional regulator [Miltoncostaeaceae bacterium]
MTGHTDPLGITLDLWRAASITGRRVDRPLGGVHGLSLVDLAILVALMNAEGGRLRRVDLAERLGMSQSSITRLLAPLEKLGIVRRISDPRDRRAALSELTAAGRELATNAQTTAHQSAQDLFADWTDEQRAAFADALSRLTAGVAPLIART